MLLSGMMGAVMNVVVMLVLVPFAGLTGSVVAHICELRRGAPIQLLPYQEVCGDSRAAAQRHAPIDHLGRVAGTLVYMVRWAIYADRGRVHGGYVRVILENVQGGVECHRPALCSIAGAPAFDFELDWGIGIGTQRCRALPL